MTHHTKKYDGSLHYRFAAERVFCSKETLVLYRPPGATVESYRGSMASTHPMLLFYYRETFHNILVTWRPDWSPRLHYVNIATPAQWSSEKVSCIDLDLDVFRVAGTDHVVVDDEHEFETHSDLYNYPSELVVRCRAELNAVCALMRERRGPYSDSVFRWRPGDTLDSEHTSGANTIE